MEFRVLSLGPIQTNAFLWIKNKQAVLVDAPEGSLAAVDQILGAAGAELIALLLTHGHWDHTMDAAGWAERGVPVYAHEGDRELFEEPDAMIDYLPPGVRVPPIKVSHWVRDGQKLSLLDEEVEVRHVPGHAPGNVLFYLANEAACFSGDVIFAGGIGRYDLPGGDYQELMDSIRDKVYTLPDETEIYPGHGPVTRVGHEKKNNPFTA